MRPARKIRFEDLVDENKKDLKDDQSIMDKIEKRMEERSKKRY